MVKSLQYQIKQSSLFFVWLLLAGCALCACSDTNHATHGVNSQDKHLADSLANTITDIDSLKQLCREFTVDKNDVAKMMTLQRLGVCQREQNKFVDAISSHTESLELAQNLCDTIEMIGALNNIGTNYRRMSMLENATTFHYRALRLCEQFTDKQSFGARKSRVVSLNGLGNISLRLGDLHTADSVFRQALEGERQLGSALGQAINYANIGAIFEEKNLNDSAWTYYMNSMKMNVEAKSDLGIALCHSYFGSLYEKEGNTNKAIGEYMKAFEMKGKIDTWHWLNFCSVLANLHIKQGNRAMALQLLTEAEKHARDSRSRGHLASIYAMLSKIYEKSGNHAKALDLYKISRNYNDSIISEKNIIDIQNERVQYEYHRHQQEVDSINAKYNQERKTNNIIAIFLIALTVLAIITILSLLYTLRIKKKRQHDLQKIDQMKSSFFTSITHEFRTPITVISALADQITKEETTHNAREIGKTILRNCNNLLLLINQILDVSKLKSAANNIKDFKHGNIVGHIHTIVESTRQLASRKQIDLVFSPEKNTIEMDFIPDYINKIISNLVSNAIKFTPVGGRIYITANSNDDSLTLIVADNGCGIDKNDVPHIFDIFYQGNNHNHANGFGIGLSLVKQLVDALNGTITLASALNKGCVFTIVLPIKQQNCKNCENINHEPSAKMLLFDEGEKIETDEEEAETNDNKPIILVVEDNNDIIKYMGSVIKDATIIYAYNGAEGLKLALNIIPDLIITDIRMPEMDGLTMTKLIRKSEIVNHIPVIAVTAKCSEEDKVEGLKAGINSYIYKPFNTDELNATIHGTLEQRRLIQENFARNNESNNNSELLDTTDQAFLNKVIDLIYKQMAQQNVNPADIASALCIGTKQLNRKITAITGESLSKYILQVRMNKAKNLFDSNKGLSINDIALRCGYDENSNFTRAFKSVFGITPSQYRKTPQTNKQTNKQTD